MGALHSEASSTSRVVEVLFRNRAPIISALLSLAAVVGTTTTVGYPGFQDLGEWLYQAQVLVDILSGGQAARGR